MKLLFDENLPRRLRRLLHGEFDELRHVEEFDLLQSKDRLIWEFAASNDFLIVTRDRDFFERSVLLGPPPKIVWLRIGNASTADFALLLRVSKPVLEDFVVDVKAGYCILPPGLQL